MTPLLNAIEKKQIGLCSFIPKAARVKMQQHSSKDYTHTLGKERGSKGEEVAPFCVQDSSTATSWLEPWCRIANDHTDCSHSYF